MATHGILAQCYFWFKLELSRLGLVSKFECCLDSSRPVNLCSFAITIIQTSTKLPTKRLTTNLPDVKRAIGLFPQQRQPAETLMEAGVVFSSPPIRVCVVFGANRISI